MASKLEDGYCRDCNQDEIYIDLKEEPSTYKIGAICDYCDRDYGVITNVPRSNISHIDDVWDQAEQAVKRYLD